jgi:bacillithiol biosynthesis cysteine-adding enzyme BshC
VRLKNYAFNELPFSDLFKVYTSDYERLSSFYETNPFDTTAVIAQAKSYSFSGDRDQSVALLKQFNKQFYTDDDASKNIERLRDPKALAIVTGQQLGLYGGPVFTMFKTLSAINLANQLEKEFNQPVVPVFWLADEDHDYDEVRKIHVLNDDSEASFSLPSKDGSLPPVAELAFAESLGEVKLSLRTALVDSDFSDELWDLLDDCFVPGHSFLKGFGNFMARLFSRHGLVLAGSNQAEMKHALKEPMVDAVRNADEVRDALGEQSVRMEEAFHRQATIYDSHLFYLHPENGRTKIQRDGEEWKTDTGQNWSSDELIKKIEDAPELFSPDVFLRPVLQDVLLPTLGYVAGPGEVAYYGQMKTFYRCFDQHMPVIFPRFSGTFIEPSINRILQELPFDLKAYDNRIEDLESEYVDRTEQTDIESIFESWKEEAESAATIRIDKIAAIDDTLRGAAEKVQSAHFNDLDKLKGKVYRSVKKREEIQLKRIRRIQLNLFPGGNLQERSIAGIYFMNKFGVDIWDRLLKEMKASGVELESLGSHQLIYL